MFLIILVIKKNIQFQFYKSNLNVFHLYLLIFTHTLRYFLIQVLR